MIVEMRSEQRVGDLDDVRRRLGNSGHVRRAMGETLEEGARIGKQSAIIYAPERTRRLKREIDSTRAHLQSDGSVEASVGVGEVNSLAGNRYGPMREGESAYPLRVHEGTGLFGPLHRLIRPRRARAMRFVGRTGLVYARTTRGQRPQPFMAEAFVDVHTYISASIDRMVSRILDTDL